MHPNEETNHIPQPLYNQITKHMPIVSVEAIITRGNTTLLLKRNNSPAKGEWWFPGGRIRRGESLEQALRREIKEETGLEITSCKLINVYSRVFPERHDIAIVYRCRCKRGNVKLDYEHSAYRFFKTPPDNLNPFMLETIKDAKQNTKNAARRKQKQRRS